MQAPSSRQTADTQPVAAELRRGLLAALPVMAGFVPFALVLGAQARQKGLSPLEVPLMTGLNFGGGSEFAAIALWDSPPDLLLIVAITILVNSRHLLMGAALDGQPGRRCGYLPAGTRQRLACGGRNPGRHGSRLLGDKAACGVIHGSTLLAILLMALATYLTRILGYLLLRNRVLGSRATAIMEAAPGCVLIAVIAPYFVSGKPTDLFTLALILVACTRLPMLPTVLIGVAAAALLQHIIPIP